MGVSDDLLLQGGGTFTSTDQQYDAIDAPHSVPSRVTTVFVQIEYLLLSVPAVFDLSPTIGIGSMHIQIDAQRVSLGALGEITIPESGENRTLYSAGLVASRQLVGRVGIRVSPMAWFSPAGGPNYSIQGGVSVGLL